jgi:Nuclease-related domain
MDVPSGDDPSREGNPPPGPGERLGRDASRGAGNVAGMEPTPTIPLVPLLDGTMSVPVAGGFPSSSGFAIGNGVPSGLSGTSEPPATGKFPGSGELPATPGLDAIDGLLAESSAGFATATGFPPRASGPPRGLRGVTPGSGWLAPSLSGLAEPGLAEPGLAEPGLAEPGEPATPLPWLTQALRSIHPRSLYSALRARVSVFRNDPRSPWVIRHAALAACVGATLAFLVAWQLGLAAAVLAATADFLYRPRTSPVVPASARALSAQRRTRRRLNRLTSAGYLSLHARRLPDTGTVVDHLLVGPAGMYLIVSERWDRRLPVRTGQEGQLFHGPFDQSGRIEYGRRVTAQASMLISRALGQPITIRPVMVIHGPAVSWAVARINGVDVLGGRGLRRYVRHERAANRGRWLNEAQIVYLHALASQVLPTARGHGRPVSSWPEAASQ